MHRKNLIYNALIFSECPRRELNPYRHYCPQDFKSCVSTSSTTGAEKKNPPALTDGLRAEDRARTGHPNLGKVMLYQMSYFRL